MKRPLRNHRRLTFETLDSRQLLDGALLASAPLPALDGMVTSVQAAPVAVARTASQLVKGGLTRGSIDQPGERDTYQFVGARGDIVELVASGQARQQGFRPYVEVFAPSGAVLDRFYAGNNRRLVLREDGSYRVQIRDDNLQETGTYVLGLESVKPGSPNARPLAPGRLVSRSINHPLQKDQFTFEGARGHIVELAVSGTPRQQGFRPFVQVIAPSGTVVDRFYAGNNRRLVLRENGNYLVQVHDNDLSQTGTYVIGLESLKPSSPNASRLVPGGLVSRSINHPLQKDQFVIRGVSGNIVELAVSGTPRQQGFRPFVQVIAPSGTVVDRFYAGNNRRLVLRENGNYLVQVHDNNLSQTGSYVIGLESLKPTSPNASSLVPGGLVSRSINHPLQKDQFVFRGVSGNIVELAVSGTPRQQGFRPFVQVIAPSGTVADRFYAGQNRRLVLRENGSYLVQVHDNNLSQTGTYVIGLESLKPPSRNALPLIPYHPTTRTIHQPLQKDQFIVRGRAGQRIELAMNTVSGQAGFRGYAELIGPSGTVIDRFYSGQVRQITLRETGTHLLQSHDDNLSEIGSYRILLKPLF